MCVLCDRTVKRTEIGRGLSTLYREISPSEAVRILSEHNTSNRTMKAKQVERISGDIEDGRWVPDSGEFCSVDPDMNIVSGQHRLQAIVSSGQKVGLWFIFGVQTHARIVCDSAVKRGSADALLFSGADRYAVLQGAALRVVVAHERGYLTDAGKKASRLNMSQSYLAEQYVKHTGLVDSAAWATEVSKVIKSVTPAVLAWGHYTLGRIDQHWADQFWADLEKGNPMHSGDPRLAMLNMFNTVHLRKSHNKVTGIYVYGISKAWNYWLEDRQVRSMNYFQTKVVGSRRIEDFAAIPSLLELA